jgi:putative ABC transport system ATP-binding protein
VPDIHMQDLGMRFDASLDAWSLSGVTSTIPTGMFTLIAGPSGSGKTTLLSIIGGLVTPSCGKVVIDGTDIAALSLKDKERYRREKVGFVFQAFRLVEDLTAEENILLSLNLRGLPQRRKTAIDALAAVGMEGKGRLPPHHLSGGEKQRVAVARALAHQPQIILADEPTSSLDSVAGQALIVMLKQLEAPGRAIVVVSHDSRFEAVASKIIRMSDGAIQSDETRSDKIHV